MSANQSLFALQDIAKTLSDNLPGDTSDIKDSIDELTSAVEGGLEQLNKNLAAIDDTLNSIAEHYEASLISSGQCPKCGGPIEDDVCSKCGCEICT